LVVRKKPIWARRWVLALVGSAAVLGILAAVILGKVLPDRRAATKQREIAAVSDYGSLVQQKFPPSAQAVPPTGFQMFPTLPADLSKLPTIKPALARKAAKNFGDAARTAADGIQGIDVQKLVPEEFTQDRLDLVNGQFSMVQSLRLYETISTLMSTAAGAPKAERTALITRMQALAAQAQELFDHGYRQLVNIRVRLGIQPITQGAPQTPIPPIPSPTATSK
jgi:hypothetical protein